MRFIDSSPNDRHHRVAFVSFPVFQRQVTNSSEFPHVVSHESDSSRNRNRSNHEIVGSDQVSVSFQFSSNLRVASRRQIVERKLHEPANEL